MTRGLIAIVVAACLLSGCASQFAKSYLGKDVVELELENGRPANVVDLGDGRRAYQYLWGGGSFVTPSYSTGTATVVGNQAFVQTTTMPGTVVSSPGCIINFIAERRGDRWFVIDAKWPDRLVC